MQCQKCQIDMVPGVALMSTVTGMADFSDGEVVTMHPGGPGLLVDCLKCPSCGHSLLVPKPREFAIWKETEAGKIGG